jgi:stage IV sporulation protein FB
MSGGFSLGRLFGFPVFVNWSALFILAFIVVQSGADTPEALLSSVAMGLVIFASILVHELGHAAVATYAFGLGPAAILLHGFGGLTRFRRPERSWQSVVTDLAGPFAGLALGVAAFAVLGLLEDLPPLVEDLLTTAVSINVFWSLFNLLPMLPLDGGNVLLHGLSMVMVPAKALVLARGVSVVVAVGAAAFGYFVLHSPFIAIVAALSVFQNLRRS